MIAKVKTYSLFAWTIISILAIFACTTNTNLGQVVIHEIYKIEGDEETKKPTTLAYKDVKHYDDSGNLVQQNFYKVDNTLKGYEFINREGQSGVTNYFDADSTLLAIYNLEYEGKNIVKRIGYDGQTKELLRTEVFIYNDTGQKSSKEIYDSQGLLNDVIKMAYNSEGNEDVISRYNNAGQLIHEEKFSIVKKDSQGRWNERWGYIGGQPNSFHRRTYSY